MTLTRESMLLILISLVDLSTTLFLLRTDSASEGNPLMSYYLNYGVGTFVMVKLTLVILPLFIAEYSRQFRPKFVRFMLRATIAAYLGTYLALFLTINVMSLPKQVDEARGGGQTQTQAIR